MLCDAAAPERMAGTERQGMKSKKQGMKSKKQGMKSKKQGMKSEKQGMKSKKRIPKRGAVRTGVIPTEFNAVVPSPSNFCTMTVTRTEDTEARKQSKGKADLSLLPPDALAAIARVREYGAKKFGTKWDW